MKARKIATGLGWALAIAVVLGAAGGVYWWLTQARQVERQAMDAPGPTVVETTTVEIVDEPPVISQTGFVQAVEEVDLAFEISGRVAAIADDFEVGAMVARSDVLARLSTRRIETRIAQARAELERARAQFQEAQAAFDRQETLEDRNVTAPASLQDAAARRASAEAAVNVAQARLRAAQTDLDDASLVAPFDGIVSDKRLSEGSVVQPGASVGHLIGGDRARVVLGLAQSQLAPFGEAQNLVGLEVTIHTTDDEARLLRRGAIVNVDPRIDRNVHVTNLIVEFSDPFAAEPSVRIGQLVRVDVPLETGRPIARLSAAALQGRDTVWVVGPDNRLRQARVTVLLRDDETAYIAAGDLAGTRLVTTDLTAPTEGQRVALSDDAGARL
ncbi:MULTISPECIES: efflux RND transporter periplasmic adaptor subunit [unclassified Roseitalea]|uniref:efflux RND transporter periplasmic adaptor subunit n=1 Tax=unclassified Roseitalea TaxID=2639107 RepID=UPI00273F7DF0|nr:MULTISPECIES: efflux RND transporter periplasmic adaptor subunit [unclassified Roseitalea]